MSNTRNIALASLFFFVSTVAACGPETGDDSGGGTTEETGGSSGATTGGSSGASTGSSSGVTTGGDVSHVGEPCPVVGDAAVCVSDGAAGYEFCVLDGMTGENFWSPCLAESCSVAEATRPCEGGQQYCTSHVVDGGNVLLWGGCVIDGECMLGETADCGFEDMPVSTSCILDENGVPTWDPNGCNTPLVLRFDAAVEFAPVSATAADFDMHGGLGVCTRADWPSPATPWLALDLDRSGSIDGGHELFGSGTRLSSGTGALNGFLALAELDEDHDGKLSAADARWSELVLWADHDGDRRSIGWEMLPLASLEVVEIELAYASRRECDGAGNCGVERARFLYRTDGQTRVGEVVDVHLACE